MPIPFFHPKPVAPGAFNGKPLPLAKASILSQVIFQWVAPIMSVGYTRPLEADDLWTLTDDLQCQNIADELEGRLMLRLPPSRRPNFKPLNSPPRPLGSRSRSTNTEKVPKDPENEKVLGTAGGDSLDGERTPVGSHEDLEKTPAGSNVDLEKTVVPETIIDEGPIVSVMDDVIAGLDPTVVVDVEKLHDTETKPAVVQPVVGGKKKKKPVNPEDVKMFGRRKAKKIAAGKLVVEDGQTYDMSLLKAMFATVWFKWLLAVAMNASAAFPPAAALVLTREAALQVCAPLVTKKIIIQLTVAFSYHQAEKEGIPTTLIPKPRSVGYGIGLAFGLFVMQMCASLFTYQGQQRAAVIGFMMRASLIDMISRKSMRLSGKSRIEMTNGRLTTMVSADASFLDFSVPLSLNLISEPIQIIVGIALLIWTLGYSALVGLGVLIFAMPFQVLMFFSMINNRRKQMVVVDKRVRLLSEVIGSIRAVKLYAYEAFFGDKVMELRREELEMLRRNGANRAVMFSTITFVPTLATVLTFVTYSLSGHDLNPAIIFTGLQYFNIIKTPITFLPLALTATTDAVVGIGRIGKMLQSEELKRDIEIDPTSAYAIDVEGDFQFASAEPPDTSISTEAAGFGGGGISDKIKARDKATKLKKEKKEAERRAKKGLAPLKSVTVAAEEREPFALRDIDLQISRGALVCIVGRVATGKSAMLTGLINEMHQLHGHIVFGGPVSYVPQHAWVQSGTIRENITFSSKPEDVDVGRVNEIIDACGLRPDIDMWPDGDMTRIGEKGITLSGGQRQRICLARAAYDKSSEVVLLDDPLSAVDAHVGHHLLHRCILNGPLASRTRLLVTHHLDVLPYADLVLVMDRVGTSDAKIIQKGTYASLRESQGIFRTLMEEFGTTSDTAKAAGAAGTTDGNNGDTADPKGAGGKLILEEERETGAVSWHVYYSYAQSMGSMWWAVLFGSMLALTQVAQVFNSLFLGFWTGSQIPGYTNGDYMAIYAALGVAMGVFTFGAMFTMILAGIRASLNLFDGAWRHVMRSPTGWHDRTPTGRIISRLSKDIEMLDDRLSFVWNQLLQNALDVVGTFSLVVYTFPYLGLIFVPLVILYYLAATYYRKTSREIKRVDSISRSAIYSSFGEQLSGLPVIRAFGQQDNFERKLQVAVNVECQAYIITIAIQRWLGVRLDLMSNTLVLLVAIFGAIFRNTVSPSKLGVVLTYTLASASVFSQLVQLFAQVEQEMNNVERVQYYNELQVEAAPSLPNDPQDNWPSKGEVVFKDVEMRYRHDLPLVLKGLNFRIQPGEKVGIIGRTGAGKSSIAQALFRTVELSGGSIEVDGLVLADLGLDTVRNNLAIIPQDAFLFGGTVRENIDPAGTKTDAELNDALNLIHNQSAASHSLRDKFRLDGMVQNEGANFSAGERQLLALVRALARGCKLLLLDEATSSVDPETDQLVQRIVQTEFQDVTLISIAHRLQTVAYSDRVIVLDSGSVVEFDTPLVLFDNPRSAFRSLCDKARISRQDLLRIQMDAESAAARMTVRV